MALGLSPKLALPFRLPMAALPPTAALYADYSLPGGDSLAREALVGWPLEPRVVVAATDALTRAGADQEATDALDRAWADLPGDRTLRRARLRRGLPVSMPAVDGG